MRRRYRTGRFLEKLERIREVMPNVAFTTDVIVGFPGETDAEFQETVDTCRQAQFMKMHIFPFSARKTTPAATMPDQVSPEVRKDRCARLAEVEQELAFAYYQKLVGQPLEVLVERTCLDRPGWVRGTDRSYAPVEVPGGAGDVGQFVTATAIEATRESVRGER